MTNTTGNQELAQRIERMVQDEIAAIHQATREALERAFGTTARVRPKVARKTPSANASHRRTSTDITALSERLYELVSANPGETMMMLADTIGASSQDLHRPMKQLKEAGKVRTVGKCSATRYFPMAKTPASSA